MGTNKMERRSKIIKHSKQKREREREIKDIEISLQTRLHDLQKIKFATATLYVKISLTAFNFEVKFRHWFSILYSDTLFFTATPKARS